MMNNPKNVLEEIRETAHQGGSGSCISAQHAKGKGSCENELKSYCILALSMGPECS
ncbi:MAG: hypothetical protein LLG42_08100 [Chloroflexi bacterium]|nr:hypothetical protein [Chloroflexota bacterium]